MIRRIAMPGAALVAGLLSACAGTAAGSGGSAAMVPADSLARLEAVYRQRIEASQQRFSDADVRFMTDMIAHHEQALEMAELAASRTEDLAIATLARRIHAAQVDEIATMRRWLTDRGQPVPSPGASHDHSMPGMISPARMADLAAARGATFDRLFLTLMIEHHQGAVQMVRELFATDGAGQDEEAFKLASDAQVDQITEIERMQRMLQERLLR